MGSELVLAEKVSSGVTVASAESEGVREWRSEHPPPPPALGSRSSLPADFFPPPSESRSCLLADFF
jgi:hypothetical protein